MRGAALLYLMLSTPAAGIPSVDSIRKGWEEQEKRFSSAEISWEVARDSRAARFGFADDPIPHAWRVSISGTRWQVDGQRLTSVGKDRLHHLIEADPAKARLEFRQILLEQRLKSQQLMPQREALTVIMTPSVAATTRAFSKLELSLSTAAVVGTRPLLLIHTERLTVTGRKARFFNETYTVVEERMPGNSLRELWIDVENGFRIIRMVERKGGFAVGQTDLIYAADRDRAPNGWTVMRFDEEGNVVEFAVAENVKVQANTSIAADTFAAPGRSAIESLAGPTGNADRFRRRLRAALDSIWLSVLVPGTIIFFGYARWTQSRRCSSSRRIALVRSFLIALMALVGVILLRETPIFDPTLTESQSTLLTIWTDVQDMRSGAAGQPEWNTFAEKALPELELISRELESCLHRKGMWSVLIGRDRPTELARLDLIGAAKHDLPAVIRAGSSVNDVRDYSVATRLDRVDDHLAGLSSYIIMPRAKAELPSTGATSSRILLWFSVASGAVVIMMIGLRQLRKRPPRDGIEFSMPPPHTANDSSAR